VIKKKLALSNLLLVAAVLFSMLFQSMDSYRHMEEQRLERHCHHTHARGQEEFTHQHHGFDKCSVCEFTLHNFLSPEVTTFHPQQAFRAIPYFFTAVETPTSFSGSTYSLRGPPCFIV
jgi:hypothetical protein